MNYLNTILMPEMNSSPNFTLEINFGWPPKGWGTPYGGGGIKNMDSGFAGGAPPTAPSDHIFHSRRSHTRGGGTPKKILG